jgi:hypothetical protein
MAIMKEHLQNNNSNLAFNRNLINNYKISFQSQFKILIDKIIYLSLMMRKSKLSLIYINLRSIFNKNKICKKE